MTRQQEIMKLQGAAIILDTLKHTSEAKAVRDAVEILGKLPNFVEGIHKLRGKNKSSYLMSDGSIVVMSDADALQSARERANSVIAKDLELIELRAKVAELTRAV